MSVEDTGQGLFGSRKKTQSGKILLKKRKGC